MLLMCFASRGFNFVNAYLECALWSSLDDSQTPLDQNYTITDISDEVFTKCLKDLIGFLEQAKEYLNDDVTTTQVGHDFWLTRNHHGVGFWDRPKIYGKENAEKLTEIAHQFGEINLYVGDDGKLYFI